MDRKFAILVVVSVAAMVLVSSPTCAEETETHLDVSVTPQEISIHVGNPDETFDIHINNSGNESVKLRLAGAQLPADWTLQFFKNSDPIDSIEIGPRSSVNFTAKAIAGRKVIAGVYTMICNISDNHSHSWEQPLVVQLLQYYDIDLQHNNEYWGLIENGKQVKKPGIPNGTVEFKFFLRNLGNGPDKMYIEPRNLPASFGFTLCHNGSIVDEMDLDAFQCETMALRVAVPAGYSGGDLQIFLIGTSLSGLRDSISFIITSDLTPPYVDLNVGPFMDEADAPVSGAIVSMSNAGGRWSNLTDSKGIAVITAHPSCLVTDVMITATHPRYEDLEFPGTVGLSDFAPAGGVYPVFIKRPQVMVGPILGSDGKPVANASLVLSDGARTYSGLTDRAGLGGIYIPKGLLGKPVHLTIECKGFAEGSIDGNVSRDGKFEPAGGGYPTLVRRVPLGPVASGSVPVPEPALWIGLGSGLLVIAGFIAGTEVGRSGFFLLMMPLYSRVNRDNVLDNFSRGRIYGHVVEHPGINFTELKGLSNIANGTLTYHLKVLEGEGLIIAHNRGTRRIFFPTSLKATTRDLVLNKSEQMVYNMIRANPGISQAGIAEEADLSEATIHRIVGSLELKGLVSVEKGVRNRCFVRTEPAGMEAAAPAPPIFPAER